MTDLRLAVVAGATDIDAAILDPRDHLVARAKLAARRHDEQGGIDAAIRAVVGQPGVDPRRVLDVVLGLTETLHDALAPDRPACVAVIRIGGPLTWAVPPLATWPDDVRQAVSAGEVIVRGGIEYNGSVAVPLDTEATARFLAGIADTIGAVAVAGIFSTASSAQEEAVAEIVRRELGSAVHLSLSHEIGTLGLIERENATVLNAALVATVEAFATAIQKTLAALAIDADIRFAANDGTVMALEHALRFPVRMIGGAVASSICGAGFLSGINDAVVVDVGGSSTGVAELANGFPHESSQPTLFRGIRTSVRIPHVRSLPFGGGSVLHLAEDPPLIGPASVASDLTRHAWVFGGSTPTLTDAAVAGGRATIGTHRLDDAQRRRLRPVLEVLDAALVRAVDEAESARPDPPLIIVGGAGFLVPARLSVAGGVIRSVNADIAAAVGAATGQVSGEAERICANRTDARRTAHAEARAAAFARATAAGADPTALALVDVEEVPFAHVAAPAVRIRVRVLGPRAS